MHRWNEKEKLAGLLCLLAWLLAGWVYFVHLPLERARASARQACDEARRHSTVAVARLAAAEADLAALPALGDFRLRLTPAPVLQVAALPDGLRPRVMRVLDTHGFGGAEIVEGTVSGFFDR